MLAEIAYPANFETTTDAMSISQGDVWQVYFAEGHERPGVVVTRNELNSGRLLLVVPCTATAVEERTRYSNNVLLPAGTGGLRKDSVAQVHLIQPVDRRWFQRCLGRLDDERLGTILQALAWAVDFYPPLR